MKELHNATYMRQSLVISTAHIPKATNIALHQDDGEVEDLPDDAIGYHLSYDAHQYGWHIYVSDQQIEVAKQCGHPELAALIELAYQQKFDYLELDNGAENLPDSFGKPVFEW